MSDRITAKTLKKQKEKVEKLMSVFGTNYNEWLYQLQEDYIKENNERALEELLNMREKFSKEHQDEENEQVLEKDVELEKETVVEDKKYNL